MRPPVDLDCVGMARSPAFRAGPRVKQLLLQHAIQVLSLGYEEQLAVRPLTAFAWLPPPAHLEHATGGPPPACAPGGWLLLVLGRLRADFVQDWSGAQAEASPRGGPRIRFRQVLRFLRAGRLGDGPLVRLGGVAPTLQGAIDWRAEPKAYQLEVPLQDRFDRILELALRMDQTLLAASRSEVPVLTRPTLPLYSWEGDSLPEPGGKVMERMVLDLGSRGRYLDLLAATPHDRVPGICWAPSGTIREVRLGEGDPVDYLSVLLETPDGRQDWLDLPGCVQPRQPLEPGLSLQAGRRWLDLLPVTGYGNYAKLVKRFGTEQLAWVGQLLLRDHSLQLADGRWRVPCELLARLPQGGQVLEDPSPVLEPVRTLVRHGGRLVERESWRPRVDVVRCVHTPDLIQQRGGVLLDPVWIDQLRMRFLFAPGYELYQGR